MEATIDGELKRWRQAGTSDRAHAVPLYPAATFARRLLLAVLIELAPHKQGDLAAVLGISQARVSQIMSGRQNLSVRMLQRLLAAAEELARRGA